MYAGAIVTLFLFVLAYLGERVARTPDRLERYQVFSWIVVLAVTVMGAIVMLTTALPAFHEVPAATENIGSPEAIGFAFLRQHLLPFEATSLVLLVAAVGAVLLSAALALSLAMVAIVAAVEESGSARLITVDLEEGTTTDRVLDF